MNSNTLSAIIAQLQQQAERLDSQIEEIEKRNEANTALIAPVWERLEALNAIQEGMFDAAELKGASGFANPLRYPSPPGFAPITMRDVQYGGFDGQPHQLVAIEMKVHRDRISNAIDLLVRDVPEEQELRERRAQLGILTTQIEEAIARLNELDTP